MAKRNAKEIVRTRASAKARRAIALLPDTSIRALVVVEKDLLEGGLATRQRLHLVVGERGDERPDLAAHLEAQGVRTRARHGHARQRRQRRRLGREDDLDGLRAKVA